MTNVKPRIQITEKQLQDFCERHHIRKLSFFGSVLGDDFGANSDIDILVEFEEDHIPGFEFFTMQDELSKIFNCPVDLNTPGFLSPHIRAEVLEKAKVQYEKDLPPLVEQLEIIRGDSSSK